MIILDTLDAWICVEISFISIYCIDYESIHNNKLFYSVKYINIIASFVYSWECKGSPTISDYCITKAL